MKKIEGPQDLKLEFTEVVESCPSCIDERLVRLAGTMGHLVCPNCDLVVSKFKWDLPPYAA